MMNVLRAIASAVVGALKAMGRVALAPVRAVETMLLGAAPPVVELPEIDHGPVKPPVLPMPTGDELWDDHGRVLQNWCADSLIADRPVPVPPCLPRAVKDWCVGLSREECDTVLNSTRNAVISHIRNDFKLADVRKLQPLAPAEWTSAPKPVGLDADVSFSFSPITPR